MSKFTREWERHRSSCASCRPAAEVEYLVAFDFDKRHPDPNCHL